MRHILSNIFIANVRTPRRSSPNLYQILKTLAMKAYRVYFKKNGINLTKLVYAESLLEVLNQFKGIEVVMVHEVDMLPDGDVDVISLN
jgi:hypothetical protein